MSLIIFKFHQEQEFLQEVRKLRHRRRPKHRRRQGGDPSPSPATTCCCSGAPVTSSRCASCRSWKAWSSTTSAKPMATLPDGCLRPEAGTLSNYNRDPYYYALFWSLPGEEKLVPVPVMAMESEVALV